VDVATTSGARLKLRGAVLRGRPSRRQTAAEADQSIPGNRLENFRQAPLAAAASHLNDRGGGSFGRGDLAGIEELANPF
jgi:hypothetical protein